MCVNRYILISEKIWHKELFFRLKNKFNHFEWLLIDTILDFSYESLKKIEPSKILIPHWSHIIPKEIYENYECIVFHMTDLPFGRGGSPLQNLIVRGFKETKIAALKVEKGIDTGGVYLKKTLSLEGTAEEIFKRASVIIEEMVFEIIAQDLQPIPQKGEVTVFKRRKQEESNIKDLNELEKIYDYIRMLDCEGYPHAFIETSNFKYEFTTAKFNENAEIITANVRITKK